MVTIGNYGTNITDSGNINNEFHETVEWYELSWMFNRHVETDIAKIKETVTRVIEAEDRQVQFRFEKRVSSIHAYNRAVKDQHRVSQT